MNRHDIIRISIENTVESALKRFGIDTPRSARILMDTGAFFSKGRFSDYVIKLFQSALDNEEEGYFEFLKRLKKTVDQKRILDFFINLGYESWTYKAKDLRKYQEDNELSVPWIICQEVLKDGIVQDLQDTIDYFLPKGTNCFLFECEDEESFKRIISYVSDYKESCFIIKSTFDFQINLKIPSNCFLLLKKHDGKIMESFLDKHLLFGLSLRKDSFHLLKSSFKKYSDSGYLFIIVDGFDKKNNFEEKFINFRYNQKIASFFVDMQKDILEISNVMGISKYYIWIKQDYFYFQKSIDKVEKINRNPKLSLSEDLEKYLPKLN